MLIGPWCFFNSVPIYRCSPSPTTTSKNLASLKHGIARETNWPEGLGDDGEEFPVLWQPIHHGVPRHVPHVGFVQVAGACHLVCNHVHTYYEGVLTRGRKRQWKWSNLLILCLNLSVMLFKSESCLPRRCPQSSPGFGISPKRLIWCNQRPHKKSVLSFNAKNVLGISEAKTSQPTAFKVKTLSCITTTKNSPKW